MILAETWNGNESGLLWLRLWILKNGVYQSKLICSGVFIEPTVYSDEASFWAAYESQAAKYRGKRKRITREVVPDVCAWAE